MHDYFESSESVKAGSERSFGLLFALVFAVPGGWSFFFENATVGLILLGLSALFLVVALTAARILRPLNILWFTFGRLLHKIVSPLIMVTLFFVAVTPISLIMRLSGKDPLRLKMEPEAESYWLDRDPPGPAPDSLTKQF
jgi:hypothetical protein